MDLFVFLCWIASLSASPINVVQKAIDNDLEKQDNYLPKVDKFPKFHYATFGDNTHAADELLNDIDFETSGKESLHNIVKVNHQEKPKSFGDIVDFVTDGAAAGMDILKDIGNMLKPTAQPETGTEKQEITTAPYETTTEVETTTLEKQFLLDPVVLEDNDNITTNRTIRQEGKQIQLDQVILEENDNNTTNRTTRQEEQQELDDDNTEEDKKPEDDKVKESQESEEEEEEEEEDENMITGLISAFLGGLSRPDGSVDVEAITGLLGSLSSQKEDGTYDFNGLTELLMSFFGGGGEDGGGSDFGAFLGGLVGAFIKGVANPPGSKGAGTFVGNLLGGILPGLSAPAPNEEGDSQQQQPAVDSGGFFSGLLSSVFGNLGGLSNSGSSGSGDNAGGGGNKFSLFKAIFSTVTGIFSSSSSSPPPTAH